MCAPGVCVLLVCVCSVALAVLTACFLSTAAVHSGSFAGSSQRDGSSWMGEDVKNPVRGVGLPSILLQEKKGMSTIEHVCVRSVACSPACWVV